MASFRISTMKINIHILKTIGLFGFIVICIAIIVNLQTPRLKSSLKVSQDSYQKEEAIDKISLDILKSMPDLGFSNLIADWVFLQFVQYYGDGNARDKIGYTLSPDYLEIVTKYDPRFVRAYLVMSPASSINAGRPDKTVKIIQKGLDRLSPEVPDAHYVWIYKGVDELLFLGDNEAAKHSYHKASEWAKIAKDSKIEQSAHDTVEFLSRNPDSKVARINAWFMVYANSPDLKTREFAKSHIESLGGKFTVNSDGTSTLYIPEEK